MITINNNKMKDFKVVVTFEVSDGVLNMTLENESAISDFEIIGFMENLKKSLLEDANTVNLRELDNLLDNN